VTIRSDLYCTLFTFPPSPLPLSPFPTLPKAIARGFLVLFHIGIWSPSTIYPHLNLLHSPFPSHLYAPILWSWFSLLIFKVMFKEVSQCMPTVGVLYFGLFNPFYYIYCFAWRLQIFTAILKPIFGNQNSLNTAQQQMFWENILKTVLCILLPTVQNKSFFQKKFKNQHALKILFRTKQMSQKLFADMMICEMIHPNEYFLSWCSDDCIFRT
jgi:hypothetical protein